MFPLSPSEADMKRSEIRYALGRCKTGNPDPEHLVVLERYQPELDEYGMHISQFMKDWDIDFNEPDRLVFGPVVKKQLDEHLPKGQEVTESYIKEIPETSFAEVVDTSTHALTLDVPTEQPEPKARKKKK